MKTIIPDSTEEVVNIQEAVKRFNIEDGLIAYKTKHGIKYLLVFLGRDLYGFIPLTWSVKSYGSRHPPTYIEASAWASASKAVNAGGEREIKLLDSLEELVSW